MVTKPIMVTLNLPNCGEVPILIYLRLILRNEV
nr:MAG TPA: hypothetical protein [Caudoviricetes sp.]